MCLSNTFYNVLKIKMGEKLFKSPGSHLCAGGNPRGFPLPGEDATQDTSIKKDSDNGRYYINY